MVTATRGSNPLRIIRAQRPAADIDLMRSVIQRFASAVDSEPVPIVWMDIIFVGPARRGTLPQIPIQLRRHGNFFADANRLSHVDVPGLGVIRPADQAGM